jgi:hypothetical protein
VMTIVWVALSFGCSEGQVLDWDPFIPDGFIDRALLKVFGSELIYYGFDAHTPLVFTVRGPTQVRVLSRLRFTPEMHGEQSYEVILFEGGVERERILHRTTESKKAFYVETTDVRLGKAMKMDFTVSDTGHHTFEVRLDAHSKHRVEARIYTVDDEIEIAPYDYAESVVAFLSESRERTYYLLTREQPVRVRVSGPIQLTVETRLDYVPEMAGKQMYVLNVLEDGEPLKSFHIESVRSSTVSYKDRPTIIPGAAQSFEVEVPEGMYTYEFQLPTSQFQGVCLRFLIPTIHAR